MQENEPMEDLNQTLNAPTVVIKKKSYTGTIILFVVIAVVLAGAILYALENGLV